MGYPVKKKRYLHRSLKTKNFKYNFSDVYYKKMNDKKRKPFKNNGFYMIDGKLWMIILKKT